MVRIIERINDWRADIAFLLWLYEARRAEAAVSPGQRRSGLTELLLGPQPERR